MSLTWILILSIGSPLVYLFGIGVTYALCPRQFGDGRTFAALFWPLAGPALAACAMTQRFVARSKRTTLPRAEVRRG